MFLGITVNTKGNRLEVTQYKLRVQYCYPRGQITVSNSREFKPALDDFMRVFDLRLNSYVDSLLRYVAAQRSFSVHCSPLAAHHCSVSGHLQILCFFPFFTATASIWKQIGFLSVQKVLNLDDLMRFGGCRHQRVDQSGFGYDSDLGFQANSSQCEVTSCFAGDRKSSSF
jgi:hypothetical protein